MMRIIATSMSTLGCLTVLAAPASAVLPEGRVCGKVLLLGTDDPVLGGGSGRVTDVCLYTSDDAPSADGAVTLTDVTLVTTPSVCLLALPCVDARAVSVPVPAVDPSKVVVAVPVTPFVYDAGDLPGDADYLCAFPVVFDNYGPGEQREVGIKACARQEPVTVTSTSLHLASVGAACVDVAAVCTPPVEIAIPIVDVAVAANPIVVTPRLENVL